MGPLSPCREPIARFVWQSNRPPTRSSLLLGNSWGRAYWWGGKTAAGIDCSGLVQVAYAAAGYQLPRDSNQQFLLGRLIATRWHLAGLHPGDTLYFLGSHGRIRHTGIYIGGDRYLHAQMPVVSISSLNPEHVDYDARRRKSFAFAKRLLD